MQNSIFFPKRGQKIPDSLLTAKVKFLSTKI